MNRKISDKKKTEKRVAFLKSFIKEKVEAAEKKGVVVGISGGVDSAACLYLAVSVLGKEKCMALCMPHKGNFVEQEPKIVCESLGVKLKVFDLSPITNMFTNMTNAADSVLKGNFAARLRSAFLYHQAALNNMLVLNTSNMSEIMTGYFTKWGDEAGDISPFANYYKSEVYEMASYLNVPDEILKAPPSAGFFNNQKDEEELGISYKELDRALALICEGNESKLTKKTHQRVQDLVSKSFHKRNSPIRAQRL